MKLFIVTLFLSCHLYADSYVSLTDTLSDSGSEISIGASLFLSSERLDIDGNASSSANENYSSLNGFIKYSYGFTSQLETSAALNLRTNQANIGSQNFSGTGLESIRVGIKYSWQRLEGIQYQVLVNYRKSLFTNSEFSSGSSLQNLAIGDDEDSYYMGFLVSHMTESSNFLELQVGYQNPGSNLSSEIITDSRFVISWKPISFILGADYLHSFNQDAYTDDPANKPLIASGPTNLWNSINRSYLDPYIGINLNLGTMWRVESKVASRISGKSTDSGLGISLALVRRKSNRDSFSQKNSAFKQYEIDGVVTKVTKSRQGVIVDKGIKDGLGKGKQVDFYHFDYIDGDELIATGYVIKSSYNKAIVKVTKRYSKKRVEEGTVIRSGLIR